MPAVCLLIPNKIPCSAPVYRSVLGVAGVMADDDEYARLLAGHDACNDDEHPEDLSGIYDLAFAVATVPLAG